MVVWLSCKMLGPARQGKGFPFGKGSQKESFLGGRAGSKSSSKTREFSSTVLSIEGQPSEADLSVLGSPQTSPWPRGPAADAHLMILCFSGNTALPANVKDWVRRWARLANNQNSALVTLDQKARASNSVATHSYLRRILDAHKIDFFPHGLSGSALRVSRPE